MRRLKNIHKIAGVVLLSLQFGHVAAEEKKAAGTKVDLTKVVTVLGSKSGSNLNLGGTIVPKIQVSLNAEFPGRITYLAGKIGDTFDKGSLLLQIDDAELLAKRQEILAQINIAHTNIRNAGVQHNRAQVSPDYNPMMGSWSTMFNKFPMNVFGNGNKKVERYANVYNYQAQLEQAHAGLQQAEAQLRQLDSKLRNTQTIAPFSGTIVGKTVEVGDTIQPGQPLLRFANLGALQMMIDVPTRVVPGLKPGMLLPATIDSSNIRMEVEVAQIYPMADLQKHTVKIKLNLPKGVPASPGLYAEVSVPDNSKVSTSYPVIPRGALLMRGSLPAVFLVNDQDEPELRLVRIGKEVENNMVQVLSGIQVGDRIVASPKARGWKKEQAGKL